MASVIEITDHLILPFGTARKFDLERIKLSAVAANGIYLRSDIPCVYINVAEKQPLTMASFFRVFGHSYNPPDGMDTSSVLDFIHAVVREHMPPETTTRYETTFLGLYFDFLKELPQIRYVPPLALYNALIPLPQMQLYVHDSLEDPFAL